MYTIALCLGPGAFWFQERSYLYSHGGGWIYSELQLEPMAILMTTSDSQESFWETPPGLSDIYLLGLFWTVPPQLLNPKEVHAPTHTLFLQQLSWFLFTNAFNGHMMKERNFWKEKKEKKRAGCLGWLCKSPSKKILRPFWVSTCFLRGLCKLR